MCCLVREVLIDEYGAMMGRRSTKLREKPASLLLYPLHIQQEVTRDRPFKDSRSSKILDGTRLYSRSWVRAPSEPHDHISVHSKIVYVFGNGIPCSKRGGARVSE
jgi:hypothetical protein